jgi:hypothetical protein
MESQNQIGDGPEMGGEESIEDAMAPDCYPWPQDDTPDAKPDETLAAIDIAEEKKSHPQVLPPSKN